MSNRITFLCFIIVSLAVVSTARSSDSFGYVPGELLVRFETKPDGKQRTLTEKNSLLSSVTGGDVAYTHKIVPGLTLVKLPKNVTVKDALLSFQNLDGIIYAEPNYRVKGLSNFPDDPLFDKLWGMHNTGQVPPGGTVNADVNAPEGWDIHTGRKDIIVAVIDSGVDYMHPDLKDNIWVNEAELNGEPDVDDDNNGYIDDIYGYDFCTFGGKERDSDPMDDYAHGTAVAGIAGAVGNNSEGVTGVCWNTSIMALKFLNSSNAGDVNDAISCI